MPGYPHKASYFEYRLCHKFSSGEEIRNKLYGPTNIFFVTEFVLKVRSLRGYPGSVLIEQNVGWKMVYNFLGMDE